MDGNGDRTVLYSETTERFWLLRLVVEVRHDGVYVRLAPLQRSFRRIPASDIVDATETTYSAASYGGWHWGVRRSLDGSTVYRLRGERGVELVLADDRTVFVGSSTPGELAAAVRRARTPSDETGA